MKLRVGLIGLGTGWDARHLPALRALGDRFEVRAVCEQVARRAQHVAESFGATTVDGFRVMATREDIDALLLLSPQWYGPLPIYAACEAGKAIYCAAMIDLGLEQAAQLKSRVDQAGIAFMTELPRRHAPATLRLKELIATRLGEPRLLFIHHRIPAYEETAEPYQPNKVNSESTRELIELVDWCRYLVGKEPTWTQGLQHRSRDNERNDYEMLSLDFSDGEPGTGIAAQISCGSYMPSSWHEASTFRPPSDLQVCFENGIAFVDFPSKLVWFDDAGRHQESLESDRPVGEQLLSQFHRAVTSLVRRTSDLEDAYRALSIVLQSQVSFREGRRRRLQF